MKILLLPLFATVALAGYAQASETCCPDKDKGPGTCCPCKEKCPDKKKCPDKEKCPDTCKPAK